LLLTFPSSFILFAPYPESLFLLFTILCFLWAYQQHWWLAGLAGGLAALTRQQGIFLLIPLLWELWRASSNSQRDRQLSPIQKGFFRSWLAAGLIPLGLGIWLAYRTLALDDLKVDFTSFQGLIYSFVISGRATQVVPIQAFLWPWQSLWLALSKAITTPDVDTWANLAISALFLIYLVLAWPQMCTSYRLFSLAITLISFSYYTGPVHPYMGLPRHLLLAVPVFIGAAPIFNRPWKRLLVISASTVGWFFLLMLYMLEAWVA
jgi:hypothetical protein